MDRASINFIHRLKKYSSPCTLSGPRSGSPNTWIHRRLDPMRKSSPSTMKCFRYANYLQFFALRAHWFEMPHESGSHPAALTGDFGCSSRNWLSGLVDARVRLPICCIHDWMVHKSRYRNSEIFSLQCAGWRTRTSPGIVRLATEDDCNSGSFGISRAPR